MALEFLKDLGGEFVFWMGVETGKPQIIQELREWLQNFSDEDLRSMMVNSKFPPIPEDSFQDAHRFANYVSKIEIVELLEEFLGPARPSIIKVMNELGEPGYAYMKSLYDYLIDCVQHPEKAKVELKSKPGPEMVNVTCDQCHKSWPVQKDKVPEIKECVFCKAKV